MTILDESSLCETLDKFNEAIFFGRKITKKDQSAAAKWIAARHGLPRSYYGTFAPTDRDYKNGIRLFTGEKITSGAGVGHILSQEACGALYILDTPNAKVGAARDACAQNLLDQMQASWKVEKYLPFGLYCCGTCSAAMWRHMNASDKAVAAKILTAGVKQMQSYRDGKGRWKRFSFYYSLLALLEIDSKAAKKEMQYAAPVLERALKRKSGDDKYALRRRALAERVLSKV